MRLLIRIMGVAFIGLLVGRLILKRTKGLEGVEKVLTRVMDMMMPKMMDMMGPDAFDHMMEHAMPKMMDSCFSWMSEERRVFMLRHCRGLLDQMEEKYVRLPSA